MLAYLKKYWFGIVIRIAVVCILWVSVTYSPGDVGGYLREDLVPFLRLSRWTLAAVLGCWYLYMVVRNWAESKGRVAYSAFILLGLIYLFLIFPVSAAFLWLNKQDKAPLAERVYTVPLREGIPADWDTNALNDSSTKKTVHSGELATFTIEHGSRRLNVRFYKGFFGIDHFDPPEARPSAR